MIPFKLILLQLLVLLIKEARLDEDGLDDFPLDEDNHNSEVDPPIAVNGNSFTQFEARTEEIEKRKIDRMDIGKLLLSGKKTEILNRIMIAAMKRPGAKQRLTEVLPIIRTMSPTQKLTLATMVMNQIMNPLQPPTHFDLLDNNTAELMLPISMDIASMFRGVGKEQIESARSTNFGGYHYNPIPAGYRAGPKYPSPAGLNTRRIHQANIKYRDDVPPEMMPPPPSNNSYADYNTVKPLLKQPSNVSSKKKDFAAIVNDAAECTLITNDVCLETSTYPDIEILESINNVEYRHMFRGLAENNSQTVKNDFAIFDEPEIERRQGSVGMDEVQLCESKIRYARPKRARSMNGHWKYVVNTGQYTQTVRMEMCLNLDRPCSYLTDTVTSQCGQIYNYHRLLTWDETNGLSLDMFKIPTCCACQIQNKIQFAPPTKVTVKSTSTTRYDNNNSDNLINDQQSPIAQTVQSIPKSRNRLTFQQNMSQKREQTLKQKNPMAASPGSPVTSESRPPVKYMSIDSGIRRGSTKNNMERVGDGKESLVEMESNAYNDVRSTKTSTAPVKVNYNYHPIIDFFKSSTQPQNANDRMDIEVNNWLPISNGLRGTPKK